MYVERGMNVNYYHPNYFLDDRQQPITGGFPGGFPGGGFPGGGFPGGGFPGGGFPGGGFPGGGFPGGDDDFPGGGFPPYGGGGGGGDQYGPPSGPPPSYTPQQGFSAYAVDPGAIRRCRFRFTYIWLNNGRSFWFYPTFVGRDSIAGYRWRNRRWVYYGTDLRRISSFQCGGGYGGY